ncbi:MAG: hypothetical protein NTX50_03375 [Candidatus Sumerlaeota bacterium]|nr:hypothetical protein [Candidatus Sumerlaeota bacterium]
MSVCGRLKSLQWERGFGPFAILMALLESCYFAELRFAFCKTDGIVNLKALVNGVSFTPFQYRILVPWVIRHLSRYLAAAPELVTQALETLFGFSIILLGAHYLGKFIAGKKYCLLFSLLFFNLLSFNLILPRRELFPYDMSSIVFFLLGLIFMVERKWALYLIVFAVGTYNRETTCFLALIYLFTAIGRTSILRVSAFCFLQMVLWLIIKLHLAFLFRGNPQLGTFYLYFSDNLQFLMQPWNLPLFFSSFGFAILPVLFFHKRIQSTFIRKSLYVLIPYFLGMTLVGALNEIRIFVELYPVILAAYALILRDLLMSEESIH